MAMTSAAEARFDARVRPEINVMRARTAYPQRHRRPASARAVRTQVETSSRASTADGYAMIRPGPARWSRTPWSRLPLSMPTARPIRLTRRGRLVAAMLVTACTVAAISVLWLGLARGADAASGTSDPRPSVLGMTRVVVRPGQTLWAVAAQADPTADPRVVIGEIIQVNALHGTIIQPGQVLWVPHG
jgi:hypothetical protein